MPSSFVHLHVHSEYSVLDGLGTVEEYVKKAKELGQPAIALTDHGVLCGAPSFYHAARQAEIEPILGEEFYFVPDAAWRPAKGSGEKVERFHVVLLARGRRGYQVLSELSTTTHQNFYHKPLLDRAMVEALGEDAKHLVCLSGCANSIISKKALLEGEEAATEELYWWRELFPNFYIELQHHDTDFDRSLNGRLLHIARRLQLPWVITNDPHYVVEEDAQHHDALLAIQTGSDVDDPQRFRFDGGGYHLRTKREMRASFAAYGSDVWEPGRAASVAIARACKTRIPQWERRTWHIPKFPDTDDAQKELVRLAKRGLRRIGRQDDPVYVDRSEHELAVMDEVGIADFMLITRWCIEQAVAAGIPVGPGRGSVCGTLVGYLIGIHKIDPIKYDLMFERFLNPARPRMPDIDTDFGQQDRAKIFDIVAEKFGAENVVGVAAYGRMMHRKAFQWLGKAYGIEFQERTRITEQMPKTPEEGDDILPEEIRNQYPTLAAQLERLSGVRSELKGHPAGVIIADPTFQLRKLVPEMWLATSKKMCGQYDLDAIEEMGLMKEDFLGLRTLDTIALAVKFIEERTGERLDPDSWVPDDEPGDKDVYAMLAAGGTSGVFQMEGATNTRGIQAINPDKFEDVVSCTALYRTGPILAGYPEQFLANRNGAVQDIPYRHRLLQPILDRTWGVILYQEQVMEIGRELAGFDEAGEDEIKEAIKHKKSQVMDQLKPLFIQGCKETNGISRSVAVQIWRDIEGYAGYSYNRSHAVAYTFITYQTARLRCLYPVEFFAALLATVDDSDKHGQEKIDRYRRDAVGMGIRLYRPCVNRSGVRSCPAGTSGIRFGLADIKGVGPSSAGKVVDNRPADGYQTPQQVEDAVRNVGVLGHLCKVGALARLGVETNERESEALLRWRWKDRMRRYRDMLRDDVDFPHEDGDDCIVAGELTKIVVGRTKNDKRYCTWTVQWDVHVSWTVRLWEETAHHWTLPVGSIVMVRGKFESRWGNISTGNSRYIKVIKRGEKHG